MNKTRVSREMDIPAGHHNSGQSNEGTFDIFTVFSIYL